MDAHQNARTPPHSRQLIVARLVQGWMVSAVATALGITPKTGRKWRDRFAAEGAASLADRSSCPHTSPTRLDDAAITEVARLRRERLSGPAIAWQARLSLSTVGLVLRRLGLGRLAALDPKPPVIRYERDKPGELLHLDTKKLGRIDGVGHRITGDRTAQSSKRGTGWEALHVVVDDASRLAYTEILPDERKVSATAFLERARAWFESLGVTVERVMTDNSSAYKRRLFSDALASHGIRHKRTRPYMARTNGSFDRLRVRGRTLHPDHLARMALRHSLRLIPGTHRHDPVAMRLQQPQTPLRTR